MAELYVARANGLGGFDKLVVLKRILPQLAGQHDFVTMFMDEARIAATLQHQNIGEIHNFGRDGATYFYTMEYLRGRDLARVLRVLKADLTAIDLAATVAIGIGAATGLHHAHEQRDLSGRHLGMVHRDVSPSNIIVTYDGGVKLVDFGIAKASGQKTTTAVGSIKGKVPYMSPEQSAGEPVDRRSDVYSLGVVLYELATGQRLFTGDHELQTIHRIARGNAPPVSSVNPAVPAELDHIIALAMHVDPTRRYQTALELAIALEDLAVQQRYSTSALALAGWLRRLFGEPEQLVLPDRGSVEAPTGVETVAEIPSARRSQRRALVGLFAAAIGAGALVTAVSIAHTPAASTSIAAPPPPTPPTTPAPPPAPPPAAAAEPPAVKSAPARARGRKPAAKPLPSGSNQSSGWSRDSPILPGLQ